MKQLPEDRPWHAEKMEDILELFETQETGLTDKEAQKRLDTFGLNALPAKKQLHPILKFLKQFNNIIIYLLLAVMIFCFVTQEWIEGAVVAVVVTINAFIGFIQEYKADKDSEVLAKMMSLTTIVMRNGTKETVESNKIVVGDVILLQGGDKIPADARLFDVKNFQTQEAALTGEVTSNPKTTNILEKEAVLGERSNFVFSGTYASQGTAQGVVVATGVFTELGKINHMVQNVDEIETPLTHHMKIFGRFLVVLTIVVMIVAFIVVYFTNRDDGITVPEAILYAASIGVALIPEGLPAITSLTLAIGMQRMAKRKALVRQLPAVETLGAVSVICSDKTGTLTTNQMTVRGFVVANQRFEVSGTGYDPCDGTVENIGGNGPITLDVQMSQADPHNENTLSYMPGTDEYEAMQERVKRYAARVREHARLIRTKIGDVPIVPAVAPTEPVIINPPKTTRGPVQSLALSSAMFASPEEASSSSSSSSSTSKETEMVAMKQPAPRILTTVYSAQPTSQLGPLVHKDDPDLEFTHQNQILALCRCGILCNDSSLVCEEDETDKDKKLNWRVLGDPTEGALLPLANKCAINIMRTLHECPRMDVIPFESDYGYMATINRCPFDVNTNVHYRGEEDDEEDNAPVDPQLRPSASASSTAPTRTNTDPVEEAKRRQQAYEQNETKKISQKVFVKSNSRGDIEVEMGGDIHTNERAGAVSPSWSFVAGDVYTDIESDEDVGGGGGGSAAAAVKEEKQRQEKEQEEEEKRRGLEGLGGGKEKSKKSGGGGKDDVLGTDIFIFLKGAPERIFDLCTHQTYTDEDNLCRVQPINVEYWKKETEDIAAVGLRTIALAERRIPHTRFTTAAGTDALTQEEIRAGGFTLLGVVGIVDPARKESQRAIRKCRRARIKVVMITGDHAKTAAAIGKFLTLGGEVRTSTQLAEMTDEQLLECVDHVDIFARATPADKLRIVKAFQDRGFITAMTGDGVNDAPALKQAHAGIAMGISGTEVAKEASKMVLLDDNFATIVGAVEEGRKIYNSIKRSIIFTLPTNAGEGLVLFVSSFISHIPPIQAIQILYINTLTSILLSSMIPFMRGDKHVLSAPPRDPKKTFLTSTMLIRTAYKGVLISGLVIGYFYWHTLKNGKVDVKDTYLIKRYSSISCTTVLLCEVCALFNTVHLKENSFTPRIFVDIGPVSLIAIVILVALQCFIIYTPGVNGVFHLTPIGILDWVVALLCGLIVFTVVEIEKLIRRVGHRLAANYRRKKRLAEGGEVGEEEVWEDDEHDEEDGNGAFSAKKK